MARGNKYTCATCNDSYIYCEKCELSKPTYEAERFCSKSHADIFTILSKHGCGLATSEETLKALEGYETSGVTKSIEAHIKSLKVEAPKAETKVEATVAEVKSEAKTKEVETETKKFSFRT